MSRRNNPRVIIGIAGGIAAYKSLSLIRLFRKNGWEVKVAATSHALEFVTPLSIETLSGNAVYSDMFSPIPHREVQHIALSEWADVVVVAPATANIMGKYAAGIADDALSTLLLATRVPVFIAPSMNEAMYRHVAVRQNLQVLQQRGVFTISPSCGELACGQSGDGRMAEPDIIFQVVSNHIFQQGRFAGKQVLITAGPTREPIDPVRFVGNHSSGRMGFALAEVFASEGARVDLIAGPVSLMTHHPNIQRHDVQTAKEMYTEVMSLSQHADFVLMAAAVADYAPVAPTPEKIKKNEDHLNLLLEKTPDILSMLGKNKPANQLLVGFALESSNEVAHAREKLTNKNADIIILNSTHVPGAGFGTATNQITLLSKKGDVIEYPLKDKRAVAEDIADYCFHFHQK
jgi:phosphopantothenoylcysteine decarboxylase/phosphopantothenate--cysteine ligase